MQYDIFKLLRQDHQNVLQLFERAEENISDDAGILGHLFDSIKHELDLHSLAEQAVVYTELHKSDEMVELVHKAEEDHSKVKGLLEQLEAEAQGTLPWKTTLLALGRAVRQHIIDEERRIFSKMREVYTDDQLHEMGRAYAETKGSASLAA